MKKSIYFVLIFLSSCMVHKKVDRLPFKYLKFESTGCEGNCESFSILIKPQRPALLNVSEANKSKGSFSRTLNASEYKGLISLLDKMKIMELKEKYGLGNEDTKTKFITIGLGDEVKKIRYQLLAPPELRELEKYIITLRKNTSWKKV